MKTKKSESIDMEATNALNSLESLETAVAEPKKSAKDKIREKKAKKGLEIEPKAEKELKDKNEKEIIQEIIVHRDMKWKYPEGLTDSLKRKSFRQEWRSKVRRLERNLLKASEETKVILQKELEDIRKSVLMDPTVEI
jgi:hypothetical protein